MPYIKQSANKDHQRVIDAGVKVYIPENNELTLDLDSPEELAEFIQRKIDLHKRNDWSFEISAIIETTTPGHYHACVRVNDLFDRPVPLSDIEKVAYQLALGSSYKREMWSLKRIQDHTPEPIALFHGTLANGSKWTELFQECERYE
jgi:hypothetical protein